MNFNSVLLRRMSWMKKLNALFFFIDVIMQASKHTMQPTPKQHGALSTLFGPGSGAKNTFFCLFLTPCLEDTHTKGQLLNQISLMQVYNLLGLLERVEGGKKAFQPCREVLTPTQVHRSQRQGPASPCLPTIAAKQSKNEENRVYP